MRLVGVPMLTPSFMYEGVHTLHHARTRYGTAEDPEYLPLALMKPWSLPLFVLVAALLPVGLLIRFAILVPLGAVVPPVRRFVWQRFSALAINPAFRRRPPEGELRPRVAWQEDGGKPLGDRAAPEPAGAWLEAAAGRARRAVACGGAEPAAHAGRASVGERG